MTLRSPFFNDDHEAFRATVRRFATREIAPHAEAWDEAGRVPREVFRHAGSLGLLGIGFAAEHGGVPADRLYKVIVQQELARGGSGGALAALMSHTISMPLVERAGSPELQQHVLPPVLAGEKIAALACTEPSGGSDVGALRTRARRDGADYVVDGEKTFITSGMAADWLLTVVRTGGAGTGGLSLLLIAGDSPGLTRHALHKTGWLASDTANLHFDAVRVPASLLVGPENGGFPLLAANFNEERLGLAASAIAFARLAYEQALDWARLRQTFGKPLFGHQVIRHKLVDMLQAVTASQALLELTAWRMDQTTGPGTDHGEVPVAELCMLKNQATQTLAHCASEAVQILGGAGYLRGHAVERIYREVKVNAIGGGSEEMMKELAARHL
jgi:acyl-CoA dehydrogenase